MTAHAMAGDKEKCLAVGMNDHLPKPVDPNLLYAILKQWLEQKSQSRTYGTNNSRLVQSPEPLPEELAGIDINLGLARVCNNRKLYRTLLTEFVEDHRRDDELLANELRQGNLAHARHLAHTLRSVAGSIGAEKLEEKAGALEEALKNNQSYLEPLAPFVGEFSVVMKSLVNNMDMLTVNKSVDENSSEDKNQQWLLVHELENLLQEGNAKAKECLAQCKTYLQENASTKKVARLEAQIAGYDFDEANITLQEILSEIFQPA